MSYKTQNKWTIGFEITNERGELEFQRDQQTYTQNLLNEHPNANITSRGDWFPGFHHSLKDLPDLCFLNF